MKDIQGTAVPCSVRVQLDQESSIKPVEHAPDNCSGGGAGSGGTQDGAILKIKIDDAKYEHGLLIVKGEFKAGKPQSVKLHDDITGELLSDDNRSEDARHFSFKLHDLQTVPCRVRVVADQSIASKNVEHAPEDCSTTPLPTNQAPLCSITSPASDTVTIELGESIHFVGEASDPEGMPLTYEWDFNGGADARPTALVPGDVVFDVNDGSFLVHFIVTDDLGARCTRSEEAHV